MGVYSDSFVDTDLYGMSPETFLGTLEKRVGSQIILAGCEGSPYGANCDSIDHAEWYLWCGDKDIKSAMTEEMVLSLNKTGSDVSFGLRYAKKSFEIEDLRVGENELMLWDGKFNHFCSALSEDTTTAIHELKLYVDAIRKYIQPIVHCTRLFICGDEFMNEPWSAHIFEGMSIEEALQLNSSSQPREIVYTWDNLARLMEKYEDWGLFDLNLMKLPDYLR